jgi:hypothetical protein
MVLIWDNHSLHTTLATNLIECSNYLSTQILPMLMNKNPSDKANHLVLTRQYVFTDQLKGDYG